MQGSYNKEFKVLTERFDSSPNHIDIVSNMLDLIKSDILKSNGKINWWWVILNVGKLVGRIVFAIKNK